MHKDFAMNNTGYGINIIKYGLIFQNTTYADAVKQYEDDLVQQ